MSSYLQRVRANWPIATAISLLALAFLVATYRAEPTASELVVQFTVGQTPLDSAYLDEEERYFGWITSEYAAIAIRDWANGSTFLNDVRWRLWLTGHHFELEELDEIMRASVNSTIMSIHVTHEDSATMHAIGQAGLAAVNAFDSSSIPHLQLNGAEVTHINSALLDRNNATTLRAELEMPLRVMLGLLFGPLCMLRPRRANTFIHDTEAVDALDLALIGEIPATPTN